jgi:hypothetical protein
VPLAQLVHRRRAHDDQVAEADDHGRDRGGERAPREDHVVVPRSPGGVPRHRHRLPEPGHERDEQHRREQRRRVPDVRLGVDARRDEPEQRAGHGLHPCREHEGDRAREEMAVPRGPSAQAVQHRGEG